jgi:hypothetical protein
LLSWIAGQGRRFDRFFGSRFGARANLAISTGFEGFFHHNCRLPGLPPVV